jgi:hypothetical protein
LASHFIFYFLLSFRKRNEKDERDTHTSSNNLPAYMARKKNSSLDSRAHIFPSSRRIREREKKLLLDINSLDDEDDEQTHRPEQPKQEGAGDLSIQIYILNSRTRMCTHRNAERIEKV